MIPPFKKFFFYRLAKLHQGLKIIVDTIKPTLNSKTDVPKIHYNKPFKFVSQIHVPFGE